MVILRTSQENKKGGEEEWMHLRKVSSFKLQGLSLLLPLLKLAFHSNSWALKLYYTKLHNFIKKLIFMLNIFSLYREGI